MLLLLAIENDSLFIVVQVFWAVVVHKLLLLKLEKQMAIYWPFLAMNEA